jgi:hypothetical protein
MKCPIHYGPCKYLPKKTCSGTMISQPTRTPNENVTSLGYVASRRRASGGRLACGDSGIRFSSVVGCSGGIGSGFGLWRCGWWWIGGREGSGARRRIDGITEQYGEKISSPDPSWWTPNLALIPDVTSLGNAASRRRASGGRLACDDGGCRRRRKEDE